MIQKSGASVQLGSEYPIIYDGILFRPCRISEPSPVFFGAYPEVSMKEMFTYDKGQSPLLSLVITLWVRNKERKAKFKGDPLPRM